MIEVWRLLMIVAGMITRWWIVIMFISSDKFISLAGMALQKSIFINFVSFCKLLLLSLTLISATIFDGAITFEGTANTTTPSGIDLWNRWLAANTTEYVLIK